MKNVIILFILSVLSGLLITSCKESVKTGFGISVEAEEIVYAFEFADNGSDPLWCHGNTCIVRYGDKVFASGQETLADQMPTLNTRWTMFERSSNGWKLLLKDEEDRSREPSPLAILGNGKLLLSVNPTLTAPKVERGPAEPRVLQFDADDVLAGTEVLIPEWDGNPEFTEHSYRSFVVDAGGNEAILFQNIGYDLVEWTFRDGEGNWSSKGKLHWPWEETYDEPQPVRICYPAVQLKDREVHFLGVSDIVEPNLTWKDYKYELTGRKWDYDFRRLFYTWSKDIGTGEFQEWVEIASREETGGHIFACDLWRDLDGLVHILWIERALDERLREKFFPDAEQSYALHYAILQDGKVIYRSPIMLSKENEAIRPGRGRFQVSPDNRLFVFYYVHAAEGDFQENRVVEIYPDRSLSEPVSVNLERPFSTFFTASVRGGSEPSDIIDVLGKDDKNEMRYAKVRITPQEK